MNIVVYIKAVVDPDKAKNDLDLAKGTKEDKLALIINPYDKQAIEAALQLKEKYTGKVTAVSLGSDLATDKILRDALSLGVDEGIQISNDDFDTLSSYSPALGTVLAKVPVDNVDYYITGREAGDDNQSITGASIAAALDVDFVDNVDEVEYNDDETLTLTSRWDKSELKGTYKQKPLVLSIKDTANTPRLPSFKAKMQAKKATLKHFKVSDLPGIDVAQIKAIADRATTIDLAKPEVASKETVLFNLNDDENAVSELVADLKKNSIL